LKAVGGKPEEVDANLLKAVDIAAKIAPYQHHRLAAIKLNKDPVGNSSNVAFGLNAGCLLPPREATCGDF